MAYNSRSRTASQYSHRWLGVFAFLVLLIVGGSGLALWRMQTVGLQSVHDTSMAPVVQRGDAVIVSKTDRLQPGDVISYHSPVNPAEILTRRVFAVDATRETISTKADDSSKAGAPFSRSLVIGTVKYHVLKLGYALDFLRSPAGLIAAIYLPAGVVVSLELRRLSSHYAQRFYHLPGYRVRLS